MRDQLEDENVVVDKIKGLSEVVKYSAYQLALVDSSQSSVPVMSTKVCVVECCLREPYWQSSSLLLTCSRIHDPTNDSSTFPGVAVREIGCRSASMALGGCTFDTKTMLASFHQDGMTSRTDAL